MSQDRTCRRGHRVSGENKIEQGKYSLCRECVNMARRERSAKRQRQNLISTIRLSEDVRFLLENPDSLPNWEGIRTWIVTTFGQVKSQDNATAK